MAKAKVTQGTRPSRAPEKRAEKPLPAGRIAEAAARAGVGEVPASARMNWPDEPDEHGETRAARSERLDAEKTMLLCTVPGSLGARVRQWLGQGLWIDPDAPDADNARTMSGTPDRAMTRVAAIQLRALAIALSSGIAGEVSLDELDLSHEDVGLALAAIATTLDVGFELAEDLRMAQDHQQRQARAVGS
jgi:hypothetical protein